MFSLFGLVPVSQSQSAGLPWYVWLLLLVIVIAVFILLQRRSDARKAPPAQVETPAPIRTVEAPPLPDEATEAHAVGAEAVGAVAAASGEVVAEAPVAEAAEAMAAATPPARPWKSSAWRTREWQPSPPTWYPKWNYRRPKGN